jgi:membrane associated rhomboid family serine protease
MVPLMNTIPSRHPAVMTYTLIAINCAVFLFQVGLSPRELEHFVYTFALIPAHYLAPLPYGEADLALSDYLPFVTMMFLHSGWMHLIFNMWSLYLFGRTVEDRLGPGRYLAFYLACGVLASMTHAVFNPTSLAPTLGASGAIAGVMGCFIRLFPWARIIVLVPVIFVPLFFELPATVFIGLWFAVQVLQGVTELFTTSAGTGVAWWAHIGGFVCGAAFGSLLTPPHQRGRTYYPDAGVLGFNRFGY